ncbi:MAG: metal ABC transporter substrate-binding protein, partial [Coriobacteriales bacterium]|nr:metal ABC transporter substrate-binding protein [Coriobacteriales bacterium]
MKKQAGAFLAAATLCAGLITGCASTNQSNTSASNATGSAGSDKIEVVCATFPAYDWVREVVGNKSDAYEITYLMGNGVDLHSYQATVEDVAKISDADLFVYVGGESDGWAQDVVDTASNKNL